MTVQQLFSSLKSGKVSPVYLIVGQQSYLKRLIRDRFLKLIPKAERTMNFAQDDLQTVGLDTVLNDAMSAPFFGRHRLILVDNPYFLTGQNGEHLNQTNLDHLIEYLKHPLSSTILVFFAPYRKLDHRKKITKALQRYSVSLNLNHISEYRVRRYVERKIRISGYRISRAALDLLIQRTDGQLSAVMNELPKLLLYGCRTKKITQGSVDSLVTKSLNQNVFDLVNEVLRSQITQAVALYHELLLNGQQPLQINAILLSQFRLLLQVKILHRSGMTSGRISQTLRVHPYRVKLALRADPAFTLNRLARAYLGLVDMEKRMKSTQQSSELLFQMFLIKFTEKNNQVN